MVAGEQRAWQGCFVSQLALFAGYLQELKGQQHVVMQQVVERPFEILGVVGVFWLQ